MAIKNYVSYVNESIGPDVKELPMFLSPKLTELLKSLDFSKISKELLSLTKSGEKFPFSYIDLVDVDFMSFMPVNRMARIEELTEDDVTNPKPESIIWSHRLRQQLRIGALVTRILPKYAGTKELENFVHQVKGKMDSENYELRIVKGEEIRKWYHINNYYNPHPGHINKPPEGVMDIRTPLMKSCLKQPEKQPFFDIYTTNPEQVGMIIMLNKQGLLVARAVIWFDCFILDVPGNPTKGVLMDRIYYTNESDVNIFIDYAKQHGWWYKPSQAKEVYTFMKDGQVCDKGITTKLKNHVVFPRYPYIDTMCFYTPFTGRLSSTRGRPAKIPEGLPGAGQIMDRYQLHKANGTAKKLAHDK